MEAKKNKFILTPISFAIGVLAIFVNSYFSLSENWIVITMVFFGASITIFLECFKKADFAPTAWTSLGLLFTFIAFLIAFKNIDPNIDNENGNLLIKLLPVISSAFTTSIIGIFISISLNFINNIREAKTERKTNTPEENLLAMKNSINTLVEVIIDSNKKNDILLNKINNTYTALSDSIAKSVNAGVVEVMQTTMVQVSDEVSKIGYTLNENVSKQGENAISTAKNIAEEMETAKNRIDEIFSGRIQELNEAISKIINKANDSDEKNRSLIVQFSELINKFSDNKEEQIKMLAIINTQYAKNIDLEKRQITDIKSVADLYQIIIENDVIMKAEINKLSEIIEPQKAA